MDKLRNVIGIIIVLVVGGWVFYASWNHVLTIQNNATCNEPTGTQFHEDIFEFVFLA